MKTPTEKKCKDCEGTGIIEVCETCNGTGNYQGVDCPECEKKSVLTKEEMCLDCGVLANYRKGLREKAKERYKEILKLKTEGVLQQQPDVILFRDGQVSVFEWLLRELGD